MVLLVIFAFVRLVNGLRYFDQLVVLLCLKSVFRGKLAIGVFTLGQFDVQINFLVMIYSGCTYGKKNL